MKRIIVVSDSHGHIENVEALRLLVEENDYLIHLGDGASDVRTLAKEYPDKVLVCAGNCDYVSPYPIECVLEVEWIRILYCHGHTYGVKNGLDKLVYAAKEKDCAVALYGHTHTADITELGGVTLINPGTLKYPVGKGGGYCYLVVHKDKCTPVQVGETMR